MRTKTLWIKKEYLDLILERRKTIEVRDSFWTSYAPSTRQKKKR